MIGRSNAHVVDVNVGLIDRTCCGKGDVDAVSGGCLCRRDRKVTDLCKVVRIKGAVRDLKAVRASSNRRTDTSGPAPVIAMLLSVLVSVDVTR